MAVDFLSALLEGNSWCWGAWWLEAGDRVGSANSDFSPHLTQTIFHYCLSILESPLRGEHRSTELDFIYLLDDLMRRMLILLVFGKYLKLLSPHLY